MAVTPTPIIAPQQQMSYAEWQKQEAARVKAEQDRKAFEESNASECYTEFVDSNGFVLKEMKEDYTVKAGLRTYTSWVFGDGSPAQYRILELKAICTGKRNGELFTEVQSVVRWDSTGNEIENVTFTRG